MALQTKAANVPMVVRFSSGKRNWVAGHATVLGWTLTLRDQAMQAFSLENRQRFLATPGARRLPAELLEKPPDWAAGVGMMPVRILIQPTRGPAFTADIPQREVPGLPATANPETLPAFEIPPFLVVVTFDEAPSETVSFNSKTVFDEMRESFFSLEEGDVNAVARFLMKWGEWGDVFDNRITYVPDHAAKPYAGVLVCDRVWQLQSFLRKANTQNAKTWFKQNPLRGGQPERGLFPQGALAFEDQCLVVTDHLLSGALLDITSVDRLADKKYRFCPECPKLFEQKTLHNQKYCSPRCSAKARVRALRKRKQRAAPKPKKALTPKD